MDLKRVMALVFAAVLTAVVGGCAKKDLVVKSEQESMGTQPDAYPPVEERVREAVVATEEERQRSPLAPSSPGPDQELLQKVFFDYDSHLLQDDARDALAADAEILKKKGDAYRVEGHCDERGSDEYNLALGDRRARAVLDYLITLGVPEERLEAVSYGKERPADPGHGEDAWAKNRRGEFVLRGK